MSDPKVNKAKKPVKILVALLILSISGAAAWYFRQRLALPEAVELIYCYSRSEGNLRDARKMVSMRMTSVTL